MVVLHFGSCLCTLGPQRSKWKYPLGLVLTTLACIYCLFVRVIVRGTFAHLVMGMMGIEAAFRIVKVPLIVAKSKAEVFLLVAMFIPNLMGTLESTIVAVEQEPIRLHWKPSDEFARSAFYDKQHAILHGALCLLVLSTGTSCIARLRHSTRVQQARIFIEPSCLVAVASILFTHHHGLTMPWEGEGFATHPVMGCMMCLCAFFHMMTSAAHLAHPNPDGSAPDLCTPLPGGGPPALRMSRLVGAFFYLQLGFFLFIDTHMEYMGCREVRAARWCGACGGEPAPLPQTGRGLAPFGSPTSPSAHATPTRPPLPAGHHPGGRGGQGSAARPLRGLRDLVLPVGHVHGVGPRAKPHDRPHALRLGGSRRQGESPPASSQSTHARASTAASTYTTTPTPRSAAAAAAAAASTCSSPPPGELRQGVREALTHPRGLRGPRPPRGA